MGIAWYWPCNLAAVNRDCMAWLSTTPPFVVTSASRKVHGSRDSPCSPGADDLSPLRGWSIGFDAEYVGSAISFEFSTGGSKPLMVAQVL